MARHWVILALIVLAAVGSCASQSSLAQNAEPSLTSRGAPPEPLAGDLVALDQALAGGRLVEAKDLLDRLKAEGTDRDPGLLLLRAEWLIAVGRAADALLLLAMIDIEAPTRCRVVAATTMALLDTAALDDADLLLVICPLLSGPKLMIFWITKETRNAEQEASPGRDYRQAA